MSGGPPMLSEGEAAPARRPTPTPARRRLGSTTAADPPAAARLRRRARRARTPPPRCSLAVASPAAAGGMNGGNAPMPRKGSTRWRRSSHARHSSRRRTTARFPHRGAIRGCGAAVMADERAPSRSGSPDANEKLLPDCREVASRALWTHILQDKKPVSKKRVLC